MREWQRRWKEKCKADPECLKKMRESRRRYRERCKANPECLKKMRESRRRQRLRCKENPECWKKRLEYARRWHSKCKSNPECYEKQKEYVRNWYERCKEDPECWERLRERARNWYLKCKADPECWEKLKESKRRFMYREHIDFEAVRLEAFRRVMGLSVVTPLNKSFYRALEIVNNVATKLNINPEELEGVIRVLGRIDRLLMGRTSRTLAAVALLVGLPRLKLNDVCEIVGVNPSNIKYCVRDIAKSVDVFMGAGGGEA